MGNDRTVDKYFSVPYAIEGISDLRLLEEMRISHPTRLICSLSKALGVYTGNTKASYDPSDFYYVKRDGITVQVLPIPSRLEKISTTNLDKNGKKDSKVKLPSIVVHISSPEGGLLSSEGRTVNRYLGIVGTLLTSNYYAEEKKQEEVIPKEVEVPTVDTDLKKVFGLSSH